MLEGVEKRERWRAFARPFIAGLKSQCDSENSGTSAAKAAAMLRHLRHC
jgi:hypothetical protein